MATLEERVHTLELSGQNRYRETQEELAVLRSRVSDLEAALDALLSQLQLEGDEQSDEDVDAMIAERLAGLQGADEPLWKVE